MGRVFCGTYAEGRKGRLYRLDIDGTLTELVDDVGCSNGMAFTPDQTGLFYIDSFARNIYRFDYDKVSGELRNQRVFHSVQKEHGFPDGCTVDDQGYLWFALWGGSAVVRLDPQGEMVAAIAMPARKITSLTFGGEDLKTIFVTSEGGSTRSEQDPVAGAVFSANCGVSGRPEFRSRIKLPV
jgi:D-xylono/L-arabinono-1,4-lactonase